ncbi:hypothetical protein [Hydrogenophaga sp.]|uniref:hypothetical protein n=1 Tax=Hydrogenophaga sp. TaxID=1904254 RepID=UPI003F71269C
MFPPSEQPLLNAAPPESYRLLSLDELACLGGGLASASGLATETEHLLVISAGRTGELKYPAFQVDGRLNEVAFARARALFATSSLPDHSLWDSLRTRYKSLGGMSGVDFLLGYFHPDVAAMTDADRNDHFEEILQEEVWRAHQ